VLSDCAGLRASRNQATPSGYPTQSGTARRWFAEDGPRGHLGAGADRHRTRDDDVGVETDAVLERDVGPNDAVRTDSDGLTDAAGLDDRRFVHADDRQPDGSFPTHRAAVSPPVEIAFQGRREAVNQMWRRFRIAMLAQTRTERRVSRQSNRARNRQSVSSSSPSALSIDSQRAFTSARRRAGDVAGHLVEGGGHVVL
jgi:hypothetical protein